MRGRKNSQLRSSCLKIFFVRSFVQYENRFKSVLFQTIWRIKKSSQIRRTCYYKNLKTNKKKLHPLKSSGSSFYIAKSFQMCYNIIYKYIIKKGTTSPLRAMRGAECALLFSSQIKKKPISSSFSLFRKSPKIKLFLSYFFMKAELGAGAQ